MKPNRITWSQYREGRRWQWKIRKYEFIFAPMNRRKDRMLRQYLDWWAGPTGYCIKMSGGDFKRLMLEAKRRKAARALKVIEVRR